jgi:hypothetical protein
MRRTSGEQKDLLMHADLSADVRRLLGNDTWSVTPMADLIWQGHRCLRGNVFVFPAFKSTQT